MNEQPTEACQDELAGIREKIARKLYDNEIWGTGNEHLGNLKEYLLDKESFMIADQILSLTVSSGGGDCSECEGERMIKDVDDEGEVVVLDCPTCNGTGQKQPKTLGDIIKEALK